MIWDPSQILRTTLQQTRPAYRIQAWPITKLLSPPTSPKTRGAAAIAMHRRQTPVLRGPRIHSFSIQWVWDEKYSVVWIAAFDRLLSSYVYLSPILVPYTIYSQNPENLRRTLAFKPVDYTTEDSLSQANTVRSTRISFEKDLLCHLEDLIDLPVDELERRLQRLQGSDWVDL